MPRGKRTKPNERLKDWRLSRDMKQADVAELFGVTTSAVCDWEKGARRPRLDILIRMEEAGILEVREWAR